MLHPPITASLMFIFWAECVVIGVFNVIKLTYVPPLGCDQIDVKAMSFAHGSRAGAARFSFSCGFTVGCAFFASG